VGKRILLTGIGGFIGAHCTKYWIENTDWEIIGIDSFRHKGSYSRLNRVTDDLSASGVEYKNRLKVFYHDLNVPIDPALENLIMGRTIDNRGVVKTKPLHYIINMASDSAVERSTSDPTHCLRNNYELAINMLEFARRVQPDVFVQISTDEVMGEASNASGDKGHREWDTIMPSNPYAASKAAQEAVAIAYWRTYNVPVVLTNCMNIIGEMQDPEKFLPRIIQCVSRGQEIPIYADLVDEANKYPADNGKYWKIGSRVYLDARNKADALKFIVNRPVARYAQGAARPDRYNICGDTELNNLELAERVARVMGKPLQAKLVSSESARPGYDRRYALDGTKLREIGWKPPITFDDTLKRVIKWTFDHQEWI
jgi:dTDP-glucose 4,6-dehydratase